MKWYLSLLSGVVAVVLVSTAVAWCQGARSEPAAPVRPTSEQRRPEPIPAPQPSRGRVSAHAINEQLVNELMAILKETKSPDTFLVTVKALSDLGPRAKVAVPTIIRNAERLGLLKDILEQPDDEDQVGPGVMITEAITLIVAGRRDGAAPGPVAPAMFPPPPPPPPTNIVRPLGCPVVPRSPALAARPATVRD